ncbi:MAG TPA: AlkA N-terminal domain-containing protein [Bryobacteraceae bacterium]|nr:AlkA N-terminal domain-containing protein [Bryobacteraceae bacterium]
MIDPHVAYRALTSRDSRFDGVFFVGVTSTGIYCRPICPVKTPQERNCRFFASAEAAEKASFRPCLRCRPELAPGHAPVDRAHRIAHLLAQRIDEGRVDEGVGLEEIAEQFQLSSRQLRRIVQQELGVSPIELLQTRRLLLAKQLLTETTLPVTEIAFASGFSSLRRFNDAFRQQYRMPPTRLRRKAAAPAPNSASGWAPTSGRRLSAFDPARRTAARRSAATLRAEEGEEAARTATLQLAYRPPYDWAGMLAFLDARKIRDVEHVAEGAYLRTVRLGRQAGWIRVTQAPERNALLVEFPRSLMPVLPTLLGRLRHLFDLTARPDVISGHLAKDRILGRGVKQRPGLRVPGAFDGHEMALRAVLGQQITVKAATTIAGRFAEAFGRKIETPFPELTRLTPLPEQVARAGVAAIARLGIIRTRAKTLLALARAFQAGTLRIDAGADPEAAVAQLTAIPGIGPWTAHYIAMRGLRWPDAFPKEDIALRQRLGGVSAKQAEALSQAWRPWRSYAVLHLWNLNAPASRRKRPTSNARRSTSNGATKVSFPEEG